MEAQLADLTRPYGTRTAVIAAGGAAGGRAAGGRAGGGRAAGGRAAGGRAAGGRAAGGRAGEQSLPVLPGLRELIPGGGLARGSIVTVPDVGLLLLALAVGPSAAGSWCALAGVQEAGVLAGKDLGLCTERILLTPHLGPNWPQVVASLVDGCEIVIVRPPTAPPAQLRRRMEAALRRAGGVLLVAGDWPGANLELRVVSRKWSGLGDGHGRLRSCRAEVKVFGRGAAGRPQTHWLWLPAEDGTVSPAAPPETPIRDLPARLHMVRAG